MSKPIALINHYHVCPKVEPGPVPHVGGVITSGQSSVTVNGRPVACVGDKLACQVGGPDVIVQGAGGLTVNGKPVARQGDSTAHGGVIVQGEGTVLVG